MYDRRIGFGDITFTSALGWQNSSQYDVYALDAGSGAEQWRFDTDDRVLTGAPAAEPTLLKALLRLFTSRDESSG